MSVMYESAHDAITFAITWNEFYHSTQPDTISNIRTKYIFQTVLSGNICDLTELHNEKNPIWKLHVNRIVSVTGILVNVCQIS